MLICPVCRDPLQRSERTMVCTNRHSFDIAREGYVNLLRTNHPGDSRDMVAARGRFLGACHYQPIAQAVCERAVARLAEVPTGTVLDSGCGEGYYLRSIQQGAPAALRRHMVLVGVDSSRDAIRAAARHSGEATFAVTDIKDIVPIAGTSIDVLLDIFAPRNIPEFRRVLAPNGVLIIVIPQQHHLTELRASVPLLGIESAKAEKVLADVSPYLTPVDRHALSYVLSLNAQEVHDVIAMSPSARHVEMPDAVEVPYAVTVAVEILMFRR